MLKSTAEPNILVLFEPDVPLSLNLTLTHTCIPCLATQMWQKHHNRKGQRWKDSTFDSSAVLQTKHLLLCIKKKKKKKK